MTCVENSTSQACCIHCETLINHSETRNDTKTLNIHSQSQQCGYQDTPGNQNVSIKNYVSKRLVSFHSHSNNSLLSPFFFFNRSIHQT